MRQTHFFTTIFKFTTLTGISFFTSCSMGVNLTLKRIDFPRGLEVYNPFEMWADNTFAATPTAKFDKCCRNEVRKEALLPFPFCRSS